MFFLVFFFFLPQSWELITEEDPNDSLAQSLPAPSSVLQHSPTPAAQEFSEDLNLRLSITPETNGELPGPSSSLVIRILFYLIYFFKI